MKIVIASTLGSNDPEVHRAGCADVARGIKRRKYSSDTWTFEAADKLQVTAAYWDCIWNEAVGTSASCHDEASTLAVFRDSHTKFLPCCAELPDGVYATDEPAPAPAPASQPKVSTPRGPVRTDFYMTVITKPVNATQAAVAIIAGGWADEGMPKVVATLGYLVRTNRLTVATADGVKVYSPAA